MRTFQPSLVIEDSYERPIAVVEVTSLSDMSLDVVMEIRRSMLERGLPAHIPYFLLLSQDIGFLWKDDPSLSVDSPPNYEFPMDTVMVRYSKKPLEQRLYTGELEYLFLLWLMDLRAQPQEMVEEPEKKLTHAGFMDAIHRAMILMTGDRETL
ncbi:MAG TPA: hypothetical protein VN207_03535 [Ktedonobacteraceae bacterium]|nr:hypothetical protein [Ktedonobacteraceae bacterium]